MHGKRFWLLGMVTNEGLTAVVTACRDYLSD